MRTNRATHHPTPAGVLALTLLAGLLLALPAAAQAGQTLTVNKAGTGTGTVTSSPAGISCGVTCSAEFADGEVVLLTGAGGASTGAVKWAGCDAITAENRCEVTMSEAKAVTATFDLLKRQLSVSKAGGASGTVTSVPAGIQCGTTCVASYDHGTAVTLTATPGPDSQPVQWSGCTSVSEGKCNVTMSGAKSVTATFKLPSHELTVTKNGTGTGTVTSSPGGISCGATCSASFEQGSSVTLTGSPGTNTKAVQWTGCDSVNGENKCVVTIAAARSVTATFNVEGPLLSVTRSGPAGPFSAVTSSPAGIECGATCSANFVKDSTVTLTGLPGLHVEAVQWTGCTSVNGENKCLVTISAAKEVTATFDFEPGFALYGVAVERTGTGQGTVTGSPGSIQCGPACTDELITGTVLTLTATPAPGSAFSRWSGGKCSGTAPTCTKAVDSSRTVKAIFTATGTRTLTIDKAGAGAGTVRSKAAGIECKSSCTAELDASKKVTLTATPDPGSAFAGFSGACTGTKACKLTMSEARQLTATFNGPPPPDAGEDLGGKRGAAVIAAAAKVKKGVARVKILCNGPSSCKGTLRLLAKFTTKGKAVSIGTASFDLAPGSSKMLAVRLSRRAKAALKATGHLKARVRGTGIHPHPVSLKPQAT